MPKLKTLEDVKSYLDRLALKSADDFEGEEYLPLDEYFIERCQNNTAINIELRDFTFNEYMDGKISFEQMIDKIMKEYN